MYSSPSSLKCYCESILSFITAIGYLGVVGLVIGLFFGETRDVLSGWGQYEDPSRYVVKRGNAFVRNANVEDMKKKQHLQVGGESFQVVVSGCALLILSLARLFFAVKHGIGFFHAGNLVHGNIRAPVVPDFLILRNTRTSWSNKMINSAIFIIGFSVIRFELSPKMPTPNYPVIQMFSAGCILIVIGVCMRPSRRNDV